MQNQAIYICILLNINESSGKYIYVELIRNI